MRFRRVRGTIDRWESTCAQWYDVYQKLVTLSRQNGYEEVVTPLLESKELFFSTIGRGTDIVEKQIFAFDDKKGRSLALRPEGTAPIMRALIESNRLATAFLPLKLFYWGPMFRYERPQQGRYRQFHQYGVEIISDHNSVWIDVELVRLGHEILRVLGVQNYVCQVNFLPTGADRVRYTTVLRSKLSLLSLCTDCQRRVKHNPLRVLDCKLDQAIVASLPIPSDFLNESDKVWFQKLQTMLQAVRLPFCINPFLVRGLDYYNGLVFEFTIRSGKEELGLTLIGGGHYDRLATILGSKKPYLAAGMAIGIERLVPLIKLLPARWEQVKCLVILLDDLPETVLYGWKIAKTIRHYRVSTSIDYNTSQKLKSRLKRVTTAHFRYLILIGRTEVKDNTLTYKINCAGTTSTTLTWHQFELWAKAISQPKG